MTQEITELTPKAVPWSLFIGIGCACVCFFAGIVLSSLNDGDLIAGWVYAGIGFIVAGILLMPVTVGTKMETLKNLNRQKNELKINIVECDRQLQSAGFEHVPAQLLTMDPAELEITSAQQRKRISDCFDAPKIA